MRHSSGLCHSDGVGVPVNDTTFDVEKGEAVPDPNKIFRSWRPRTRNLVFHGRANVMRPAP